MALCIFFFASLVLLESSFDDVALRSLYAAPPQYKTTNTVRNRVNNNTHLYAIQFEVCR